MQEKPRVTYPYMVDGKEMLLTPQKAAYVAYEHHVVPLTQAPIARDGAIERGCTLAQEVAR